MYVHGASTCVCVSMEGNPARKPERGKERARERKRGWGTYFEDYQSLVTCKGSNYPGADWAPFAAPTARLVHPRWWWRLHPPPPVRIPVPNPFTLYGRPLFFALATTLFHRRVRRTKTERRRRKKWGVGWREGEEKERNRDRERVRKGRKKKRQKEREKKRGGGCRCAAFFSYTPAPCLPAWVRVHMYVCLRVHVGQVYNSECG